MRELECFIFKYIFALERSIRELDLGLIPIVHHLKLFEHDLILHMLFSNLVIALAF